MRILFRISDYSDRLLGVSDLAEIALICALDLDITVAAVVDVQSKADRFVGIPVIKSFDSVDSSVDAVLVTGVNAPREAIAAAVERYGAERVLVPELLGMRAEHRGGFV
jgi:hypothetical protein